MAVPSRWPPLLAATLLLFPLVAAAPFVGAGSAHLGAVEEVEFLDGAKVADGGGERSSEPYTIKTAAYWETGRVLYVYVSGDDSIRPKTLAAVQDLVAGKGNNQAQWNLLLSSFERAPTIGIAPVAQQADVKIVLTNTAHPEGKIGKTRLYVIKGTHQILSADVQIYSADRLAEQGLLEHAVAHELGHALGLSHSTDPESIMYPLIALENGSILNKVGSCEQKGITLLYVESRIGTDYCSNTPYMR